MPRRSSDEWSREGNGRRQPVDHLLGPPTTCARRSTTGERRMQAVVAGSTSAGVRRHEVLQWRRAWDNRSWCDFVPFATTNLNMVNFDALLACANQQMSLMLAGYLCVHCASVKVLKEVTKTRKVPVLEVPLALTKIKKANLETSSFFETLRGTEFPVRTWMRIFVKN
uniref:Uncharacterized protein n=1 Tax=Oryza nivara TaxID=4536 RepID=A0A0E0IUU3_ORYNI